MKTPEDRRDLNAIRGWVGVHREKFEQAKADYEPWNELGRKATEALEAQDAEKPATAS